MAEIDEECKFDVMTDQALFETQTNGDLFRFMGLSLNQGQAASLAWLVNSSTETTLVVQIKVKS